MRSSIPRTLVLAVIMAAVLAAGLARAQSEPRRGAPPLPAATPAATVAKSAVTPAALGPIPRLEPRRLPPSGPLDRGGVMTDPGFGGPAGAPNAIERAKLDAARQAVEAARLAGPLLMARPAIEPPVATPLDRERAQALKLEAFLARRPVALPEDRAAGVGPGHAPVQLSGDGALTAAERAKLDAVLRGETPPAAASPAPAARDAVVRPQDRKEDR